MRKVIVFIGAVLFFVTTVLHAQDADWVTVTGADTLREYMSGLKAERTLPSGR